MRRARFFPPLLAAILGFPAVVGAQENPLDTPFGMGTLGNRGPIVQGYITSTTGEPIRGARVEAFLRSEQRTDWAVSDDEGFYALSLTEQSDFWEIRVRAAGHRSTSERISVWRARVRQDFTLIADPRVHGMPEPENPRIRSRAREAMQAGLAKARAGDRPAAIAELRRALEIEPGYVAALNNLGVQLRLAGELAAAEAELRRAAEIAPLDYFSHFNLGTLLYDTERFAEAAEALEQAVLVDPTAPMAALYLGRAYIGLHQGSRALEQLQVAARLAGAKLDVELEMSDAWVLQGDLSAALAAKQGWLDRHPADPRAEQVRESIRRLREKLASASPS